jgi:hypothetical protein
MHRTVKVRQTESTKAFGGRYPKLSQDAHTRRITDWQRAPKDGSVINVEFPDGEITLARFDVFQKLWEVPCRDGMLVAMHQQRHDLPQDWWPVF